MTGCLRLLTASLLMLCFSIICGGQTRPPVKWEFKANSVSAEETMLDISANIALGWHLYSQYINDGGPQPTRIRFEPSGEFVLLGNAEEIGDRVTFNDSTYEMEITWYSGMVSFQQRISLNKPKSLVRGKIEYMTCNDHICVPGTQTFAIDVGPKQ